MTIAIFNTQNKFAIASGLWQYDYGQKLRIQGLTLPTAVEIHFSLQETGGESVTRVGVTKDGVTDVPIPDSMLEGNNAAQDYKIYAFIYLTDDSSGETIRKIIMPVKSRPKPEAFDTPEDTELFREAIAAVNEAVANAASGLVPEIGDNGNWFVNGVDTGKTSVGEKGEPGTPGQDGAPGKDGKSAYQYAQDGGYTRTEEEFAAWLSNAAPGKMEKKILIIGDSIAAGNGWSGGFKNLIEEDFPCAVVNNTAVSGSTLADDVIYFQLYRAYQSGFVPNIIIIDGGGNDVIAQRSIGTLDMDHYSTDGYGEDFDNTTIIGALEHLFTVAQKFMPGCKIIYTSTYKIRPYENENGGGMPAFSQQKELWEQLGQVCEKYSVQYVDFYGKSGINPMCVEHFNLYMYDFLHINETGYRLLWPFLKNAISLS